MIVTVKESFKIMEILIFKFIVLKFVNRFVLRFVLKFVNRKKDIKAYLEPSIISTMELP